MRRHRIRHLPVLRAGELVGVVSRGDLLFVETMRDVDPSQVTVEEAMTQGAFAVGPGASLASVATKMAAQRYGCAVVMEDDEVIGIFTTTDSLRAVAALASGESHAATTSARGSHSRNTD
jgi:acetoin utilization protein AcuB